MTSTAQDCVKDALASLHQRHLKPLGFRKVGNTWIRTAAWPQLINVQLSKWNSSEQARLTLNFAIFIEDLHKAAQRPPLQGSLKDYDCDLRCRIGQLHSDQLDKWWAVTLSSNVNILADELFAEIEKYGLPWFGKLTTFAAIVEEFEMRNNSFMAALALLLNGNRMEAERRMAQVFSSSNKQALPYLKRIAMAHSMPIPGEPTAGGNTAPPHASA